MRTLITLAAAVCAVVLLTTGCGSSSSGSSSSSASATASTSTAEPSSTTSAATNAASVAGGPTIGYEGVPLEHGPYLGPADTTQPGAVDGIQCKPIEQLAYHIHIHLAVFDDGTLYALPAGVGIPDAQVVQSPRYGAVVGSGRCFFWLHTHTTDGVIHVESPTRSIYTLGDFFDVWRQPLTGSRIASLHGTVSAFVDGKPWHKSVRAIPLLPHEDIQLEIGDPIPPIVTVDWKKTEL